MRYRYWTVQGASIVLGVIFVVAGLGKLLSDAVSFMTIFNPFPDFLASFFTEAIYTWLPYVEVVLGLLLLIGVSTRLMALISAVLIIGFITNNSWLLSRGLGYEPCDCFGVIDRIINVELSTTGALYMDIAMLALALIVVFYHRDRFLNIRPWFLKEGKGDFCGGDDGE